MDFETQFLEFSRCLPGWRPGVVSHDRKAKVIDFFCGCGGTSLGFAAIPSYYQIVCGVDINPTALRSFSSNYGCETFCKDIREISDTYIQYVRFAGTNRASKVVKENKFTGNLISMLKELEYLIKYSIENKRPEFVSVLREEPRINYPWEAIRELAMNSVMHRAYNGNNQPIKFYEYSDRIEIDNPGNLYGKVNIENFPNETDYRNPNIAEIMANLGYVNRFGSGVNTVASLLEENGSKPAQFLLGDMTTFKVVVTNADVIEKEGDVTVKKPTVIVNVTDDDSTSGTNSDADGTMTGTIWNDWNVPYWNE